MLVHVATQNCQEHWQACEGVAAVQAHCSTDEGLPSVPEAHVQGSETHSPAPISFLYNELVTYISEWHNISAFFTLPPHGAVYSPWPMKDMATAQFNMSKTTYKKCEVLVVMVVIMTLCNTYKDYSKISPLTSKKKIILTISFKIHNSSTLYNTPPLPSGLLIKKHYLIFSQWN